MNIKPVKNYKKPLYAVAAAAGLLSGCAQEPFVTSGIAPMVNDQPDENTDHVEYTDVPETYAITEGTVVMTEAEENCAELTGTVSVSTELTSEEPVSETVESVTAKAQETAVTAAAAVTTAAASSVTVTETTPITSGTTACRSWLQIDGSAPAPDETEETDEIFELEGDVAIEITEDGDVVVEPDDDFYFEGEAPVTESYDFVIPDKNGGGTGYYVCSERNSVYIDDVCFDMHFRCYDPDVIIGFSFDQSDAAIKLIRKRALTGAAEKGEYWYLDKADADGKTYDIIIIRSEDEDYFSDDNFFKAAEAVEALCNGR